MNILALNKQRSNPDNYLEKIWCFKMPDFLYCHRCCSI